MTQEKWQDPNQRVLSPRYLILALLASAAIALGGIGYFAPDLLSFLGEEHRQQIHEQWYLPITVGVVIGILNAILTLKKRR